MFKTDLEIAQECKMEHIRDIAAKIGVGEEDLEHKECVSAQRSANRGSSAVYCG